MTIRMMVKVCCDDMGDIVMLGDVRKNILVDENDDTAWLWWEDCDMTPLNYCPSCGKKIEIVDFDDDDPYSMWRSKNEIVEGKEVLKKEIMVCDECPRMCVLKFNKKGRESIADAMAGGKECAKAQWVRLEER